METQGQRIKKIRQELKLSQDDFGKIFGISKQFVYLLEQDKTFLNNDKLVKLLLDYNVNMNYLLAGIGNMFIADEDKDNFKEVLDEVNQILIKYGIKKQ